jgi:hypothetical protein
LAKQQEKKQRREEETFQDGCLLDSEITDELRARVKAREAKDIANDRQRKAATLRRASKVALLSRQVPWSMFGGLRAWVDEDKVPDLHAVRRNLCQRGVTTLDPADWAQAELFVVPDLSSLRERVQWRAALAGCWLLSPGVARGEQGIFVKYHAAIQKARKLWFTAEFVDKHGSLTQLLRAAMT